MRLGLEAQLAFARLVDRVNFRPRKPQRVAGGGAGSGQMFLGEQARQAADDQDARATSTRVPHRRSTMTTPMTIPNRPPIRALKVSVAPLLLGDRGLGGSLPPVALVLVFEQFAADDSRNR